MTELHKRAANNPRQPITLYHGSDTVISQPDVTHSTGFADLGKGFYLTDDRDIARKRARSRARREGVATGVVSIFELDESCVSWAYWGATRPTLSDHEFLQPFGLAFEANTQGIAAWIHYIEQCRNGSTAVHQLGSPAIVRAWIATEEVEMAYSGLVGADELASLIDPASLVTQYCFLDQTLIENALTYIESDYVEA